jgi:hypothetical protein
LVQPVSAGEPIAHHKVSRILNRRLQPVTILDVVFVVLPRHRATALDLDRLATIDSERQDVNVMVNGFRVQQRQHVQCTRKFCIISATAHPRPLGAPNLHTRVRQSLAAGRHLHITSGTPWRCENVMSHATPTVDDPPCAAVMNKRSSRLPLQLLLKRQSQSRQAMRGTRFTYTIL